MGSTIGTMHMKLRIDPSDGWGWFDSRDAGMPSPFESDVTVEETGNPFLRAVGQISSDLHPYSGMWVRLSPRHTVFDGWCTMSVFSERPSFPVANAELVASGMAVVEIISD
jgi:hypothetical protein